MSKLTRRKPTHRIYAVERRSTRRAHWMDIGTAFSHKDGKGFDLELQTMPLSATELVVRTRAEKRRADGSIVRLARQTRTTARKPAGSCVPARPVNSEETQHAFL